MRYKIISLALMGCLSLSAQTTFTKSITKGDELTGTPSDTRYTTSGMFVYVPDKGDATIYFHADDGHIFSDKHITATIGFYDVNGTLVRKYELPCVTNNDMTSCSLHPSPKALYHVNYNHRDIFGQCAACNSYPEDGPADVIEGLDKVDGYIRVVLPYYSGTYDHKAWTFKHAKPETFAERCERELKELEASLNKPQRKKAVKKRK